MAKEEKQYNFGGHKFDAELYLQNLRDNADSFLQSKTDWTPEQKEEWKHSYTNFTNALQEQIKNGTDRFSTDEFGTITDRNGEFSNVDSDDFYYDNSGKQISREEYDKLKARKQQKYTAFAANRQFANYANTIGKGLRQALAAKAPESKEFDYAHKGFASFWNKKYNPSNEKIDTKLYWSMDKDGQYTNRIAQTITDLDEYLKNDDLPDNVRANIEAYKNKLQEYSLDNKDFDVEHWKNSVQLAASRAGLGTWNNGFFNMGNPVATDEKKAFDINNDQDVIDRYELADKIAAHPEQREHFLDLARRQYNQESQDYTDQYNAAIKQEQDARNNKIWETYLAKNPYLVDINKRIGRSGTSQFWSGGRSDKKASNAVSPTIMSSEEQAKVRNNPGYVGQVRPELQAAMKAAQWNTAENPLLQQLNISTTDGLKLKTLGDWYQYNWDQLMQRNGAMQGWSRFADLSGNKVWRRNDSLRNDGTYFYMFRGKDGRLYTYRSKPYTKLREEVIAKGQQGMSIYTRSYEKEAKRQQAQQKENQKALKNPSTPHDKKVALIKQEKIGENPFSDKATALRAASLLTDVGSTIASFSGVGAPASAISGAISTGMNQTADILEGQGFWESLGNNALSYGMDALSVIPFIKGITGTGRVIAKATKLAPHIITALGAMSALRNKDAYVDSWKKMTSTPDQLTRQDWSNIYDSLKLLTTGTRAGTQAIKGNRAMKGALSKDKVKVKTNEGYVAVDKSKLEDIKGTKGLEAQNKALQKATGNSNLKFSAARNKYLFWKTKDQAKIKEADVYDFTKPNTRMINGVEYERPYKWGELGIANHQWQFPKWMNGILNRIEVSGLKPTGRTQASINRQAARQKTNRQSSDTGFVTRQTKALRDEWKVNNATNSEYQQLKASIGRARKLAASEQAAGRITQANAYRNQAQQDIASIRNLTPEYNKLRSMVQNGNITFTGKRDASRQVTKAWNDILKKYGIKYKQGGSIRKFDPGGSINGAPFYTALESKRVTDPDTGFKAIMDTSRLVSIDGKTGNIIDATISNKPGNVESRYQAAEGNTLENTRAIEAHPYYQWFDTQLYDNHKVTPTGIAWQEAADKNIPKGSKASFKDEQGNYRASWTNTNNDVYGNPGQTYKNDEEYTHGVRYDGINGARHSVFLNRGKRYFYKDAEGNKQYVNLSDDDIQNYKISEKPVWSGWSNDKHTWWDDYEITGANSKIETEEEKTKKPFDIGKFWNNIDPNIKWGIPRAMAADATNRKVTDLLKKQPLLLDPQEDHRYIQSDLDAEMNGQAQAAALNRLASEPITSDANVQSQMQLDAAIKGNEATTAGRQQSNQRLRDMSEQAWQQEVINHTNRHNTAMDNRQSIYNTANENKALEASYLNQKFTIWDTLAQQMEYKDRTDQELKKARADAMAQSDINNSIKYGLHNYIGQYGLTKDDVSLWNQVYTDGTLTLDEVSKDPVKLKQWNKVLSATRQIQQDLLGEYYGIPKSKYWTVRQSTTPYTYSTEVKKEEKKKKGGTLNINKVREAAKGEKLAVAQLKAQTADADRFYKTTKDTIDRMYDAIDRAMSYSSTKKKRKKKKK